MKKIKSLYKKKPWTKYYKGFKDNLKYPDCSMIELIMKTALKYPKNIAYEYFGRSVSYSKFIEQIEECAKALKKNGVNEGDSITICTANTPEGIIMFYAVNMVGAVANMIHPLSSENEIQEYLNLSKSKIILTIDLAFQKINNILHNTSVEKVILMTAADGMNILKSFFYWFLKGRKIETDEMFTDDIMLWCDFLDSGFDYKGNYKDYKKGDDPAVILYSGGTTGISKGVILSNKNLNSLALQGRLMADPAKEGDSVLCIMPLFHGFGLGVCIHTPLYVGMKCILIPSFTARNFPYLIKRHSPNFIAGVPTLFEALIKSKAFDKISLKSITCVISGGDLLKSKLKEETDEFLKKHGSNAKIRCGYGLTEATGATSLVPTNDYREGSIGIPFPDMYFKIVEVNTHSEVSPGTDGEICISGPTVMLGYLDNEEETIKALRYHGDGKLWLHTGDIGSMDKDGFVYFKQRLKRIIISSGYNIYPSQIESVIEEHPDVMTCTVIGVPHPYKVQVAKAFIVLKDGIAENDTVKRSIKRYCEKNIAKYSLPHEYVFKKSLPRTKIGKIAYTELSKE